MHGHRGNIAANQGSTPIATVIALLLLPAIFLLATVLTSASHDSTEPVSHPTWYCQDDGQGRPGHFAPAGVALHACSARELHAEGYWSGVL